MSEQGESNSFFRRASKALSNFQERFIRGGLANEEELRKAIALEMGPHAWDTFVGGERTTWNLKYPTNEELPVNNGDYNKVVRYGEDNYRLLRVYTKQIQVSGKIEMKK